MLFRSFHANALPLRWLRNSGMRWVDGLGGIKTGIVRRALGLEGTLPDLARAPRCD